MKYKIGDLVQSIKLNKKGRIIGISESEEMIFTISSLPDAIDPIPWTNNSRPTTMYTVVVDDSVNDYTESQMDFLFHIIVEPNELLKKLL